MRRMNVEIERHHQRMTMERCRINHENRSPVLSRIKSEVNDCQCRLIAHIKLLVGTVFRQVSWVIITWMTDITSCLLSHNMDTTG